MSKIGKQLRTAAINAALRNGNATPFMVRKYLREALNGVSVMSIAGVKAAVSKGQDTARIQEY
jgi:hypothetical protein